MIHKKQNWKIAYPLLWLLLFLALTTRLYRITNPILDWHSFRQADTASVTREYLKQGLSPLVPKYHDHSNIQSGDDNPMGYRMVEFPLLNVITASIILLSDQLLPIELTSRLVVTFFSLAMLYSLFFLVKDLFGKSTGYLSVLILAVHPYAVFYSRAVLPEMLLLFCSITSLYFFMSGLAKNGKAWHWIVSAFLLAIAFLVKPFVAFTGLVYLVLWIQADGKNWYKRWVLIPYLFTAITPFLLWRQWILQYPEGIPASDWLFNGNGIRFRPAWFRWLGYERMIKMFLGFIGVIPFVLSIFGQTRKQLIILISWWIGIVTYFIVIASGNVQHDYYQILILPIFAITLAKGLQNLYAWLLKKTTVPISYVVPTLVLIGICVGSWQYVGGFFSVNHWEYVRAGAAVDKLVPLEAKVIAPAFGDTSFLFQTNRTGWPIGFEIDDKISKGATHYVTTAYDDEANMLAEKYFILEQNKEFIILDLTKPKN